MAVFSVYSDEVSRRAFSIFSYVLPPSIVMPSMFCPSRVSVTLSMVLASLYALLRAECSPLAVLLGVVAPPVLSPSPGKATMSRVLLVCPRLLVTQISTRLMVMPVRTVGSVAIHLS